MKEEEKIEITEEQLDAIYKYLAILYDDMSDEEKLMWISILEQYDPEFEDMEDENDDND